MQQAPPAILLAALRRFRGPALFLGLRPSSRLGAPFWPSGLTLRSSGPAFCGPLTLAVSPLIFLFMQAYIHSSAMFIQFLFAISLCSFAFLQTTYVSRTDGSSSKYDRRATTTDTERAGYLDGGKVLFSLSAANPPQIYSRPKQPKNDKNQRVRRMYQDEKQRSRRASDNHKEIFAS